LWPRRLCRGRRLQVLFALPTCPAPHAGGPALSFPPCPAYWRCHRPARARSPPRLLFISPENVQGALAQGIGWARLHAAGVEGAAMVARTRALPRASGIWMSPGAHTRTIFFSGTKKTPGERGPREGELNALFFVMTGCPYKNVLTKNNNLTKGIGRNRARERVRAGKGRKRSLDCQLQAKGAPKATDPRTASATSRAFQSRLPT
jgi:hypothetical protein